MSKPPESLLGETEEVPNASLAEAAAVDLAALVNDKSPGRIFVVDDEPMVTASIKALLMLETDYDVHVYNHPGDALAAVQEHRPEVIVSDFLMPEMDGIQFLRQVKALLPETTLILLTGYSDKESAIDAINSVGIYRYIEKPWDNEQLKMSITNGLERARLLQNLRSTISQLTEAKGQLQTYNQELEHLVDARTTDLRVAYQTLDSIISSTADGIIALDQQGNVTSVNQKVLEWLSRKCPTPVEVPHVLGTPVEDVLQLSGQRGLMDILNAQTGHIGRLLIHDAHVESVPVEVSVSEIVQDETTGNHRFVLVMRDVIERREIERLRDDFMSTLTHDLRTPLLAAIQTLGFFVDGSLGPLSQRQTEILTMLINSNEEMLGLVNVLLEVYRYESGRQRLVLDQVDVLQLLKTVVAELSSLAQSKNQRLMMSFPEALPFSTGDKQELRRVFVNLLGNAINYTQTGGEISLKTVVQDGMIIVSFIDNGRGIPEQDIGQLFQRFSQGTSKQRSSGSGLGLYLSRQIVEAHKGSISVQSQEGQGSCFTVVLPVSNVAP